MIRITVELVSAIDASRDKLLGVAEIANDGGIVGSDPRFCRYNVRLSKWAPLENQTWKRGQLVLRGDGNDTIEATVEKFDRIHRGPWDLLYLALKAVVESRNR